MDDFFENFLGNKTKLHQRKKKYVVKEIDSDELFETTEETFIDENEGPTTEETSTIYQAGCGHFVGFYGPHELIAKCSKCGKSLCHRCGNLRCTRCLAILCESCAKVVNGMSVYCSKCRIIFHLKRFSLVGLKGLHQLLSKEIS